MTTRIEHTEVDAIKSLLVGRRIVSADVVPTDLGEYEYPSTASGKLTLDDGTVVLIAPNLGGCSCGGGDYELKKLASVDNAISDVQVIAEPTGGDYSSGYVYRIHVVADAIDMDVVTIEGDDGSGYYGTGYTLFVTLPESAKQEIPA